MDSFPIWSVSLVKVLIPTDIEIPPIVNPFDIIGPNGSNINIDKSIYQSQSWQSSHMHVSHRRFEIEGEAFIITSQVKEKGD